MKHWFENLPIHRRLWLISLSTHGVAVILLSLTFGLAEWVDQRNHALATLSVQADMVTDNVAPALVFLDEQAANEILQHLRSDVTIVHAELRNPGGGVVARFHRTGRYKAPDVLPEPGDHVFSGDRLTLVRTVPHRGSTIGVLMLQSDLSALYATLVKKLLWIALAMAASLAPALFLFARFQKPISDQVFDMQLASTVFDASSNAIMICDAGNRILAVNAAFCRITGYAESEAMGKTPSLLSSGKHDTGFYQAMWQSLRETDHWEGEIWNRRKSGEPYAEWLTINTVRDPLGDISRFVAIFSDITQRKAAEEEIKHLAFYDPLTRLPNRRLLLDRLGQALALADRSGIGGALLFIDLDNFKTLNDTLGHETGDQLLVEVANRLQDCLREGDTAARLGGDEFIIMLEGLSGTPNEAAIQARIVGEKILAALNRPYDLSGHPYHSTPSIGIALFGETRTSTSDLLRNADLAMYQSKSAGRNTLRFFDSAFNTSR